MRPQKEEKPYASPTPVRFTVKQLEEIESIAEELQMSKQEIIRLACSAGVIALKSLGEEGLAKAVAQVFKKGK